MKKDTKIKKLTKDITNYVQDYKRFLGNLYPLDPMCDTVEPRLIDSRDRPKEIMESSHNHGLAEYLVNKGYMQPGQDRLGKKEKKAVQITTLVELKYQIRDNFSNTDTKIQIINLIDRMIQKLR